MEEVFGLMNRESECHCNFENGIAGIEKPINYLIQLKKETGGRSVNIKFNQSINGQIETET